MSSPEFLKQDDPLLFEQGDIVEMVYQQPDGTRRWLHGHDTRHVARLMPDTVEFRLLSEDGRDYIETGTVNRLFQSRASSLLSRSKFDRAVLFKGAEDWQWFSKTVPRPHAMNNFAKTYLQPIGAHDIPLVLRHGDEVGGLFTAERYVGLIASGLLPISTDAPHFLHDMKSHGLGLVGLHRREMELLRAFSIYATRAWKTRPLVAEQLTAEIASSVDYFTFNDNFTRYIDQQFQVDAIASDIIQSVNPTNARILQGIAENRGFELTPSGLVKRSAAVKNYYRKLGRMLGSGYAMPLESYRKVAA